MSEERRHSPRHPAHLPGEIESPEGRSAITITRDVSATGLLIFTRHKLEVGSTVKLRVVRGDLSVDLEGKVVREEAVDPEQSTLWRHKVALAFEDNDAGLKKILDAIESN